MVTGELRPPPLTIYAFRNAEDHKNGSQSGPIGVVRLTPASAPRSDHRDPWVIWRCVRWGKLLPKTFGTEIHQVSGGTYPCFR